MADKKASSQTEELAAILLVLCLTLAGCGVWDGIGQPSPTPVSAALPTNTFATLPDLTIAEATLVNIEPPDGICSSPKDLIRLQVAIANLGTAEAGAFVVQVDHSRQVVPAGLAAGEQVSLQFENQNTSPFIRVDVAAQVMESNEHNNQFYR